MSLNPPPRYGQPSSGGFSTGSGSSRGSSMNNSSMGFGQPVQEQGGQFGHLPSNVKLPPSFHNQGQSHGSQGEYSRPQPMPRPAPQSHDTGSTRGPSSYNAVQTSLSQSGGERSIGPGAYPVSDIVKKLDFASSENIRLRSVLRENNELLTTKLQEIEHCLNGSKKLADENEDLKKRLRDLESQKDDATNRFFEARVAVMGFKCRTMQLQGEVKEREEAGFMQKPQPQSLSVPSGGTASAALQQQNSQLMEEKKSLEAVIAQRESDLNEMLKRKEAIVEERNRLDTRLYSLQGELQVLRQQTGNIGGELEAEKRRYQELLKKYHALKESESALQTKLERQSQEQQRTPPVPKPRTNILAGVPLQVKEQLEKEKKELEEQLESERRKFEERLESERRLVERERSFRTTVETQLQQKTQKNQQLIEKANYYEQELQTTTRQVQELSSHKEPSSDGLRAELESLQRTVERKESHITSLTEEKSSLQSKVAQLEKDVEDKSGEVQTLRREQQTEMIRLKRENDRKVSELQHQMSKMQITPGAESSSAPLTTLKAGGKQSVAVKLNNALGRIKELEEGNKDLVEERDRLEDQLSEERQKFEEDKGRLLQENSKLHQVTVVEQQQNLKKSENRVAELERQVRDLEQEERRLLNENLQKTEEKDRLRQDLSLKDNHLRQAEFSVTSLQRELEEKKGEAERLQQQLSQEESTKDKHSVKLESMQTQFTQLKDRYSRTRTELETIQDQNEQLQARVLELNQEKNDINKQKTQLLTEKTDVEATCNEFRKESESLLQDYDSCAQQLQRATEEKEKIQTQYRTAVMEVDQKNDRIKQLEQQRNDAQERLTHMDAQLKIYHEDFDRERQAREAAIKVKNLAEERMQKMEKDMKDLRDRLNRQAVIRLQEDQVYDESSAASSSAPVTQEARRSGEQPRQLSGPHQQPGGNQLFAAQTIFGGEQQYPQPQARRSGEHPSQFNQEADSQRFRPPTIPPMVKNIPPNQPYGGPPQPQARRSGEQQFNQQPVVRAQQEPVPPLPPRERPPQAQFQGGGGGGGYPMQQHQQQHPQDTPWTQQFPHTQQAQIPGRVPHPATAMTIAQGHPPPSQPYRARMDVQNDLNQGPPVRAPAPMHSMAVGGVPGPSQMPRNDLNAPPQTSIGIPGGQRPFVSPGEVMNDAPPKMACPLCGKQDFKTQTDLELHCAQCT